MQTMPVMPNSGLSVKAKAPQKKNVLQKVQKLKKKSLEAGIEPSAELVNHCLSTWF